MTPRDELDLTWRKVIEELNAGKRRRLILKYLKFVADMNGEMCDYDFAMMPRASAVLEYLKSQKTFRWWNAFFRRPKPLMDAAREHLDKNGYITFLGWDSFTCRNPLHPISREISREFRRVFGSPMTLQD